MGLELAKAWVRIRGDSSRVAADFNKAKPAILGAVRSIGRAMVSIMSSFGIIAGVGMFAGIIRSGENFQRKMRGSLAIMGEVSNALKKDMTAAAFDVAKATKFSAAEAAEAYFFLASAGLDATRAIAAMPQVAQFAQAGNFSLSEATDLLTDAQSALGLGSKDAAENLKNMTRISDVLVKANILANASVQQFSQALTADAATAAVSFGQSLETTVAVLALYADKGKKAAEAGNLFGRATRLLTKASRDNADEFEKRNIKLVDESTGKFRNFIDILEDMNKAFVGFTKPQVANALSDLGFEALAQKSILPLLNATVALKGYEKGVLEAGGTTKEVSDKQLTPLQKGLAKVGAAFEKLSTVIVEEISPALSEFISKVAIFIEGSLIPWFKTLRDIVSENFELLKGLGKTMVVLAAFAVGMKLVTLAIVAFSAASKAAAVVAAVFQGVVNPLLLVKVAAGIAAAAGTVLLMEAAWDGAGEAAKKASEKFDKAKKDAALAAGEAAKQATEDALGVDDPAVVAAGNKFGVAAAKALIENGRFGFADIGRNIQDAFLKGKDTEGAKTNRLLEIGNKKQEELIEAVRDQKPGALALT